MKAYFGEHATEENGWLFERLPRIDEDNSVYWTLQQMLEGKVKGYIIAGENPAVGNSNGKANRLGLAKLDWLVVRDLVEIESASFWYDSPEIESGELVDRARSGRRSSSCRPPRTRRRTARSRTRSGCCSGTGRRSSRRTTAARSCGSTSISAAMLKERLKDSKQQRDELLQQLTWDYPTHGQIQEPVAEAVLAEINGAEVATGAPLDAYTKLKDDGSTLCGCWIYCGVYKDGVEPGGAQEAALGAGHLRRARVGLGVAGEPPHPLQPRVGGSRRQPVVGAQEARLVGRHEVDGRRRARLRGDKAARLQAAGRRRGAGRHRRRPPVHHAGGRPILALRPAGSRGRAAARRTTSRTSRRSAIRCTQSANPARQKSDLPRTPRTRAPTSPEPSSIRT